jgi:cysteinyl-tRNA synthetase
MDDDFNTPGAIAALQSAARALNVAKTGGDHEQARSVAAEIRQLGAIIGLLECAPEAWLGTRSDLVAGEDGVAAGLDPDEIERLVKARVEARRARDFAESDRIRDRLTAAGVVLEDGAGGTSWRRK